ncbi:hypothetical protein [Metamycoplasma auris]|uniref:Single-stranded DNA-binding protein n=1 Tax=Metamycoplasma auris TaxID=51363 RepID=A0A2W7G519_9BACT|nr:hypothetical protein [Metamycoplasma auris]PZV98697.1 hypothetical protein BCF89_1165 [Metamycoplasma auris]
MENNKIQEIFKLSTGEFKQDGYALIGKLDYNDEKLKSALRHVKNSSLNTWEISGEVWSEPKAKLARNGNRYLIFTLKISTYGLFGSFENSLNKNRSQNYYLLCMTFDKDIVKDMTDKFGKGDIAVVNGFLNLETKRDLITKENKEIETVSSTNLLLNLERIRIYKSDGTVIYSDPGVS